ncbi:MAG TPA: hypothetical protein VF483_03950, partial [Gemmatimonadaceae bacterium]
MHKPIRAVIAVSLLGFAACKDKPTAPLPRFTDAPCSVTGTLSLSVAQAARVDCSTGGTTVTVAGNGASYLVLAQFAADQVPDALVQYHVSSGIAVAPSASFRTQGAGTPRWLVTSGAAPGLSAPTHKHAAQLAFDRA